MKRKKKSRSLILRIFIFIFILYTACTLISIQLQVSTLERNINSISSSIDKVKLENAEIERLLSFGETNEYIEQIAREKLGFCYPDEKVLVDRSSN